MIKFNKDILNEQKTIKISKDNYKFAIGKGGVLHTTDKKLICKFDKISFFEEFPRSCTYSSINDSPYLYEQINSIIQRLNLDVQINDIFDIEVDVHSWRVMVSGVVLDQSVQGVNQILLEDDGRMGEDEVLIKLYITNSKYYNILKSVYEDNGHREVNYTKYFCMLFGLNQSDVQFLRWENKTNKKSQIIFYSNIHEKTTVYQANKGYMQFKTMWIQFPATVRFIPIAQKDALQYISDNIKNLSNLQIKNILNQDKKSYTNIGICKGLIISKVDKNGSTIYYDLCDAKKTKKWYNYIVSIPSQIRYFGIKYIPRYINTDKQLYGGKALPYSSYKVGAINFDLLLDDVECISFFCKNIYSNQWILNNARKIRLYGENNIVYPNKFNIINCNDIEIFCIINSKNKGLIKGCNNIFITRIDNCEIQNCEISLQLGKDVTIKNSTIHLNENNFGFMKSILQNCKVYIVSQKHKEILHQDQYNTSFVNTQFIIKQNIS